MFHRSINAAKELQTDILKPPGSYTRLQKSHFLASIWLVNIHDPQPVYHIRKITDPDPRTRIRTYPDSGQDQDSSNLLAIVNKINFFKHHLTDNKVLIRQINATGDQRKKYRCARHIFHFF